MSCYIGVDLGTSALKLLLVDGKGAILKSVTKVCQGDGSIDNNLGSMIKYFRGDYLCREQHEKEVKADITMF